MHYGDARERFVPIEQEPADECQRDTDPNQWFGYFVRACRRFRPVGGFPPEKPMDINHRDRP